MSGPRAARVLVELGHLAAHVEGERSGALWRLAEAGRQLDSNLVRLPPGGGVGEHTEDALDVLLVVIEGSGQIDSPEGSVPLAPQALAWVPRSTRRALSAGPEGLVYLTVHQRRPGLGIKNLSSAVSPAAVEGGEGPCMLEGVCAACGRLSPELSARYCGACGEPLPDRDR
ncbi:hypothetical protein [Streptomyces tsukubensis]|uniref:Cupin 2 conserved barrel domain-containing protein n=1 Tax=Streptomyces tsukubensis TaxID=83656 RepID=A0A1V4AGJ1_9ACTN|nr:hypothetical protein [Streptomyces tsukubensis]OON82880.1 hypothetical protein B1H18_02345 [Streptomyces tsukubensis]QFR91937.1 hypothetical protein GBW32_01335 [Streptomyces tsukubensis]